MASREHERLGGLALQIELLQKRQRERGGFAGSGLRLPDQIASGQQSRNRPRLNRSRRLVAELRKRLEERSGKAEGCERCVVRHESGLYQYGGGCGTAGAGGASASGFTNSL